MKTNIGIDIAKINRIHDLHSKYGDRFLDRIFTDYEQEYIISKNKAPQTIAGLFSMKESIAKARGTGITKNLNFKDISIRHTAEGAPYGIVDDKRYYLSSSHDGGCVVTVAVASDEIHIEDFIETIYDRGDDTYKGSYGKLMVYASSEGMTGAGYLTSMAALRSGTGLVYHYVDPSDDITDILTIKHVEVIVRDSDPRDDLDMMDGIAIGPGLGRSDNKSQVLEDLLQRDVPMVIDADGINMLDLKSFKSKTAPTILTPHIGEFKRLLNLGGTKECLRSKAKEFAKEYDTVLILKDYETYITDGSREYLLSRPNSALSTAGSGDVLTGIIGSMVAQGYSLWDSAVLGVQLHSMAGQVSKDRNSKTATIATDLLESLKEVFVRMESVYEN